MVKRGKVSLKCKHTLVKYAIRNKTVRCLDCGKFWIDPYNPYIDIDPKVKKLDCIATDDCKVNITQTRYMLSKHYIEVLRNLKRCKLLGV